MNPLQNLNIKIFADGANVNEMKKLYKEGIVNGFTTNPTLMRNDGVTNYEEFAKEVLSEITDLPISFEVFADDFELMEKEARKIVTWGKNIFIKIPITNTKGESSLELIKKLSHGGLTLNITAMLTLEQVKEVSEVISPDTKTIVSIFAGRIADTGRDPIHLMKEAVNIIRSNSNAELLWASSRELLNIFHAESCGCHIITVTNSLLKKIHLINKDLKEFSLDTVRMFHDDALSAGYEIL